MKTVWIKNILMILSIGHTANCFAQNLTRDVLNDTLPIQTMDSVTISAKLKQFKASCLTGVIGTKVNAGKRTNTLKLVSSSNGVIRLIPAYDVWDGGCSWQFSKQFHVGGSNNLTNGRHFNRRITMYPGPAILPADGKMFTISLGLGI